MLHLGKIMKETVAGIARSQELLQEVLTVHGWQKSAGGELTGNSREKCGRSCSSSVRLALHTLHTFTDVFTRVYFVARVVNSLVWECWERAGAVYPRSQVRRTGNWRTGSRRAGRARGGRRAAWRQRAGCARRPELLRTRPERRELLLLFRREYPQAGCTSIIPLTVIFNSTHMGSRWLHSNRPQTVDHCVGARFGFCTFTALGLKCHRHQYTPDHLIIIKNMEHFRCYTRLEKGLSIYIRKHKIII